MIERVEGQRLFGHAVGVPPRAKTIIRIGIIHFSRPFRR